jgi:hypothetical protein
MAWDRVHTVNDYYDGPRLGIADVDGVPPICEAEFDHSSDEYGDTYSFRLFMKAFWPSSSKTGKFGCAGTQPLSGVTVPLESHPACLKIARDMRLSKSLLGIT